MVTLEQLRVFVAVAERQHVTQAAAALNLAQSAVSASIATLEASYGTKLFHRVGRGIELTEAGQLFLREARAVLARAASAETVLAELSGLRRGTLFVQASQTIARYWLPRHLVSFRREFPGVEIKLGIGNTAEVARAVHDGAAELGFVEGAVEDASLCSTTVALDRLQLVVGLDHPWARSGRLAPGRLTDSDWVMREAGSGTRSAFEAALVQFGIAPDRLQIVLELPSNEAVRAAVEAGLGAAVISASVVAPSIEAGLISPVRLDFPDRPFHVLQRRERYLSRAAAALLSMIGRPS